MSRAWAALRATAWRLDSTCIPGFFSLHTSCQLTWEGVDSISTKPGADIADMIGKKNWGKGLKITIGEEDVITVDCNITVAYGQSVVTVAGAVQTSVTNALESMAGVKIAAVNVNVCGIVRQ